MKSKVRKMWEIAVKYIPGPDKNPGIKYSRTKLCIDMVILVYPLLKQSEAIQILKKVIDE